MTDLRKAAEMALAYLENSSPETDTLMQVKPHIWEHRGSLVIQALRQALAQPEQEPVIGMFEEKLPDQNPPLWVRDYKPKREWVGLTGNEAKNFYEKYTNREELIYAIDEFLEEKNS